MKTLHRKIVVLAICAGISLGASKQSALAARHKPVLTLNHLKNGSYMVPDLACGYTTVNIKDEQGEADGVKVVFGQAVFGALSTSKKTTAVVHLAYHTSELGWLQELAFVQSKGNTLVQVADYILDDRCRLQSLTIKDGFVLVETASLAGGKLQAGNKLTKISLEQEKSGCLLQACESANDVVDAPGSAQLSKRKAMIQEADETRQKVGSS